MERTSGTSNLTIALIDGPVATGHPDLARERLREIPSGRVSACLETNSAACRHGTFVIGILAARRSSAAPAISPGCRFLIRAIFSEQVGGKQLPRATPEELAEAIIQCIDAGARVINMSVAPAHPSISGERSLEEALDRAIRRGVIIVAAAGNQGVVGSSVISRHPWVIPVVACDLQGIPLSYSNLGGSIGRRGLAAPGDAITSLSPQGPPLTLGGTSVAAPFVTGAVALLWSLFPAATAAQIRLAVSGVAARRRLAVVPPLLDGAAAYQELLTASARRRRL
ncbi:MAG TPA: S8 family serine peptidase [Vicinamibacterales bacterium]|nr:S8 family serine peptidase [Vicinamibacterales bacterium]